ncbi:MAG TPA: peptide-methionine (R)-S-oxide reductase MsrB [Rectinemataceae bacterium]|nr:peptide-methionine (R)-S-oxide reductase MsrB [Rectinemataceae bacterium]
MKRLAFILGVSMLLGAGSSFAAGPANQAANPETAVFGGGFRSLQGVFDRTYGVLSTEAVYAGGKARKPTAATPAENGHALAVLVSYDPSRVGYPELLDRYLRSIDPTDGEGQFADRGPLYRPVVFYTSQAQRSAAAASLDALSRNGPFAGKHLAVAVLPAPSLVPAEQAEQDFALHNPEAYAAAEAKSGRLAFLERAWGRSSDAGLPPAVSAYKKPPLDALRKSLNPMQFQVTQEEGTEPPFANEFWNNERAGIYVDIVSGEPLFTSTDKFDSGTGWPSFDRPLVPSNIVLKMDTSFGMTRIEVKSRYAGSHLGHLFDDGPAPTGLRYCMDSASLRFIPKEDMQRLGYGQFLKYVK